MNIEYSLSFAFDHVSPDARLDISFMRTLRIPDDGAVHSLPAGLGNFPLQSVDEVPDAPKHWRSAGGWLLPMYQSEAMWMSFSYGYPCMVRVGTGGVSALTGEAWSPVPDPVAKPQDYLVVPEQPWLDGFNVGKDVIRQFVAAPLGEGKTVAEQITGKPAPGVLQIQVVPMRRDVYESMVGERDDVAMMVQAAPDLGMAAGGLMRQEIYEDPHGAEVWDLGNVQTVAVTIVDSMSWREFTGEQPPTPPITRNEYAQAGIPWFDYYSELEGVEGSDLLAAVESLGK
jgi:hypothetical protein